jgi:hypothetical protein
LISTAGIVIPVGIEFLSWIGKRGLRIVIGPARTAEERRLSLLGGLVGALIADAFGVAYLAQGMVTDELWHAFPPPLAPFVLLPLLVGALAGIRFTTDLVRPARLSWRPLLIVTVGVIAFSMTGLVTFGLIEMAVSDSYSQMELVRNVIGILVVALPLAAVWIVVPGLVLAPFVAPFVGLFALIMRRLA